MDAYRAGWERLMRGHVLALAGVALVCACLACIAPALLDHALSSIVIQGSR